ncbi:SdiA-regulated domain-containing protein [Stutzerimonas stutzeri]|uniref:SdiA-regulated domain-containing protein n=1 Tax=Stutzerimonas stutzeri TaxID=316 RepID=UPI0021096610|nr:SdiA-regulated domain-containing protein [Stutzerimonas stutzeri]MCQ4320488.1 SdiA-regulated domain-containing protein [Stutzerimonas stutzeri]
MMQTSLYNAQRLPLRRRRYHLVGLAGLLLTVLATALALHWNERLYFYLTHQLNVSGDAAVDRWLPDYRVVIDGKPVEGIERNLSAITYDADLDRLLAVVNGGPTELVVLSRTGDLLAHYPLTGFGDIEGVTYMGHGRVAVSDERAQQVSIFQLPSAPRSIDVSEAQFFSLGINLNGNKGFEGLTYDAAGDRLFIVKERDPRQLYEVRGVAASLDGPLQLKILDRSDWIADQVFATDLSDIHFDAETGHLILLSDESHLVMELSDSGRMLSYRSLNRFSSDLQRSAPHPEGVTIDNEGTLFVVSEPNLFYSFRRAEG